jgi:glycerol kinase
MELQVSGGMTSNKLLMQMQADILGIPIGMVQHEYHVALLNIYNFSFILHIVRPTMTETTSLGAALAAGKAIGLCDLNDDSVTIKTDSFQPELSRDCMHKIHIIMLFIHYSVS